MKIPRFLRYLVPIPVVVLLFYLLQLYPVVPQLIRDAAPFISPPKEYVNLIVDVVIYVLLEKTLERFGWSGNTAKELQVIGEAQAKEIHKLQEGTRSKERLDAKEKVHQKEVVFSFFDHLPELEVNPPNLSHLELHADAVYDDDDPEWNSHFDINNKNALSHLQAPEYDGLREAYEKLTSVVDSFNQFAKKENARLDIDSDVLREFPKFTGDPHADRPSEYYIANGVWHIIEKLAEGRDVLTHYGKLSDLLPVKEVDEDEDCDTLVMDNETIAYSMDRSELERFEKFIRTKALNYKPLVARRKLATEDSSKPLGSVHELSKKMLDAYKIQNRLFGRCRIEDLLEEEESIYLSKLLGDSG